MRLKIKLRGGGIDCRALKNSWINSWRDLKIEFFCVRKKRGRRRRRSNRTTMIKRKQSYLPARDENYFKYTKEILYRECFQFFSPSPFSFNQKLENPLKIFQRPTTLYPGEDISQDIYIRKTREIGTDGRPKEGPRESIPEISVFHVHRCWPRSSRPDSGILSPLQR